MKKMITLCCLLALVAPAIAQNKIGKLSGSVKDMEGKPLSMVTVALLKVKDSSLVKTAITDKQGIYEIEFLPAGDYVVSAGYAGYKKVYSNSISINTTATHITLDALQFNQVASNLNEVTVSSKKPFIETRIDKTVINVEASPTSAGASALELLEKSPGVIVNNDGQISLRGKLGVIVMIDGKQTYLSPSDLANMLKNMPASAIEQFELITNPSAKYDAEGNSGLINIKTKKGKANGFNGSVTLGATAGLYDLKGTFYVIPKSQNSFNFNYRKNKFNFFGSYNPNYFRGRNLLEIDRKFVNSSGVLLGYNDIETRFKFGNTNHTLKLGFDYFADKKNTLSFTINGFTFHGHPTPSTVTNSLDENMQLMSTMISRTDNDNKFKNASANISFRHVYDSTGKELTIDMDYIGYRNVGDLLLSTDFYDPAGASTQPTMLLNGHLPAYINIYSIKSDYTLPFKDGSKLEAGIKSSYVTNDNEVAYTRENQGKWEPDNRSNHFVYKENINAAYVNLSKQIKKWSFQMGLRLENTNATGHQLTNDSTFTRNFTNLFPSVFINYTINPKNSLTLSYSRRITRPNYQDLNPFTFFLDSLSYKKGNPFLQPQFTHNFELSYAFKNKIITTVNYSTTKDVISNLLKQNDNDRIVFLTSDNVSSFTNMGVAITVPATVTNWWNLNYFANVFNNHYKGIYNADPIDISYTSFTMNATNTFTVNKTLSLELSGFYRAKGVDNLSIAEPVYQISIGAQKQIMKGKGSLRLNIRDPFAWQAFRSATKYSNIDVNVFSKGDQRQVGVTFTYRFGKAQGQQRRKASASQEEQNRVGSAN